MLKSYLDSGNQADSTQYEILTLAALVGLKNHWADFHREWKKVLKHHKAPWLHTTDAVSFHGPFDRKHGWNRDKVDALIDDCVSVIEHIAAISNVRVGLRLIRVSVLLKDHQTAVKQDPDLGTPEQICAIQSAALCFGYGVYIGADQFEFVFDQNERFCGNVLDRWKNKKSRNSDQIWKQVVSVSEADMRRVTALQAADLLAWRINRAHLDGRMTRGWQERLLLVDSEKEWYDYETLQNPRRDMIAKFKSYNLPRRKPTR
ncbi:MAG TPA: DUF3800 domain-containing protein [Bryobacteraceae bacterium]|nr:DUF3800 domain-containing protein [Bryobacteraceae bacterium]